MTVDARHSTDTPPVAVTDPERADLLALLAKHRHFLRHTTRGLTDEQARRRTTVSELCLGGLIKHVTSVERNWVRFILEGTAAMAVELPDGVTWEDLMAGTATTLPQRMVEFQEDFRMRPGDTLADVAAYRPDAYLTANAFSARRRPGTPHGRRGAG